MSGLATASYAYDAHNRRVKQIIDGETIYSVYGVDGDLIFRDNITTGEETAYITLAGRSVARLVTQGVVTTTTYIHNDHLGSASMGTSAGGSILWFESYTPFGEPLQTPLANEDNQGHTGHIHDTATGLTYMQARYYDPVIGRFLSNDPVGFAEGGAGFFNRYAYTFNDPVNMVDPTGMWPGGLGFEDEFYGGVSDTYRAYQAAERHYRMLNGNVAEQAGARAVENAISIGLVWASNNPGEAAAVTLSTMEARGLAYLTGRVAGSAAPSILLSRIGKRTLGDRAGTAFGIGLAGSNLSATQLGNAIAGLNDVFDQLEAAGLPTSILSMDGVRDTVAAAAHGASFDYNAETGVLTATLGRTGSRIRQRYDIQVTDPED